eukprot:Protomagalhaensia_sp_Gyna_25__3546@NODE_318_length_3906_cov_24_675459_g248_i0_p3_GENE_NODE_318_length_3906_cov_24_675459_g248_i0NODE_318_length_3906_cov_24_675459_g248_i0_p3_ORF_typecomplete_len154_score19_09DnaJ/PF00226_31/1_1e07zfCSL/PF05207_13/0_00011_NODE_318_length_3906_cov_24_675459_g248_i0350811
MFHSLLGLPPNASLLEARKAFLTLALQVHPDKASPNNDNPLLPPELNKIEPRQRFNALFEAFTNFKTQDPSQVATDYWINAVPVIFDLNNQQEQNTTRAGHQMVNISHNVFVLICRCGAEEFIESQIEDSEGSRLLRQISCSGCSQKYKIVFV